MLSALKVIAIVVLVGILLFCVVVLVILYFLSKLRKAVKLAMQAAQVPPARINPVPEPAPRWRNGKIISDWTEDFKRLGFQEIGGFSVPEMGGLQFKAFCHQPEQFYGIVYDHQKMDPTADLVCSYEDGTGLTVANTAIGETLDHYPGDEKIRQDKASIAEMFDLAKTHRKAAPMKPADPESFAKRFQEGYAKEINWRLKKGGASRDEIRRQAEKDGTKLTEEEFEEAYERMRVAYLGELQAACVAQYLDESKMPVLDWEKIHYRVFAIPETLAWKEIVEILDGQLGLDEEQRQELEKSPATADGSGLEVLDRVVRDRVASVNLRKIGEVSEPVRAFLFLGPEVEDDDDEEDDDNDDGDKDD